MFVLNRALNTLYRSMLTMQMDFRQVSVHPRVKTLLSGR